MTATEIKPIRTKRDFEAALKEIERLWGAKADSPEGDRLDVLATLVDAYETEHYPMDPPDRSRPSSSAWSSRGSREGIWKRSSARAPGSPKF
jgi:hypothetical protein